MFSKIRLKSVRSARNGAIRAKLIDSPVNAYKKGIYPCRKNLYSAKREQFMCAKNLCFTVSLFRRCDLYYYTIISFFIRRLTMDLIPFMQMMTTVILIVSLVLILKKNQRMVALIN